MELDLSPKLAKKVYGGDGGSYYAWCPNELPMLCEGNIDATKLALEKNGFAFPHYSYSSMVTYILQGAGVIGIILPESKEKVVAIKKEMQLLFPTWWYNKEDAELVVLFMGDTSKGHKAGQFTDFSFIGTNGIFTGFTTDFVKRAWDVDADIAKALIGNQTSKGIVKLDANVKMLEQKPDHQKGMTLNCEEDPLDTNIKNVNNVVLLNTKNLPLVSQVGLGADLIRLEGKAMCSLGFSCDSALHVTYIVKGSGRLQVVGVDGKRVIETVVKSGNLLIITKFYVVSKIADSDGLSLFSIITTLNPMFTHLAGSI